jgi:4-hydroxymandelate oxidase
VDQVNQSPSPPRRDDSSVTNSSLTSVEDYQRLARDRVASDVWDFIEGGAEAERTVAANRLAFDRVRLRPRVLTDVSSCDTRTSLFGTPVATPLAIAPTAYQRLVDPEGEVATARGARAAGALFVVSMFASRTIEDIAAAGSGSSPLWLQLYWLARRDVMADLIGRAERAGYGAIVLTVDVPRMGRRWRDMRNGFAIRADVAAVNIDSILMASAHRRDAGRSALAAHTAQSFDPSVTWADLAWVRQQTALPIVLKGILTAQDAARAADHGIDAVIVSNHGGRQLDGVVASLDALPEVVDAVAGAYPVLFDGGVRRGTDAFAALALGADAVLLGRPPLWGLAAAGEQGVAGVLRMVTEELAHTMALSGRASVADIDRSAVVSRPPMY